VAVLDSAGLAVHEEHAGPVPLFRGAPGDQFGGQVIVKVLGAHVERMDGGRQAGPGKGGTVLKKAVLAEMIFTDAGGCGNPGP